MFIEDEPRAVLTPDKETVRQQGRRIKEPNEPMFTLTVQDRHGILRYGRVRKLTPREWARLQGFPDSFRLELADTRLYKQLGNSVTVNVIEAIAGEIKEVLERSSE